MTPPPPSYRAQRADEHNEREGLIYWLATFEFVGYGIIILGALLFLLDSIFGFFEWWAQ